ncbi:hypothetical protein TYRP_022899 [Tyrophagus putrescentiae]|nr:hypothetical protein TYRP_022899 [Tyrophagus putrescentiae]
MIERRRVWSGAQQQQPRSESVRAFRCRQAMLDAGQEVSEEEERGEDQFKIIIRKDEEEDERTLTCSVIPRAAATGSLLADAGEVDEVTTRCC